MTGLSLELALRAIDAALAKATEIGCAPLTVVVLDAGGHDIALKRQDGSGILRADIARGKAWARWGWGSRAGSLGGGRRRFRLSAALLPPWGRGGWCPQPAAL